MDAILNLVPLSPTQLIRDGIDCLLPLIFVSLLPTTNRCGHKRPSDRGPALQISADVQLCRLLHILDILPARIRRHLLKFLLLVPALAEEWWVSAHPHRTFCGVRFLKRRATAFPSIQQ
jgi:hypothetical protein